MDRIDVLPNGIGHSGRMYILNPKTEWLVLPDFQGGHAYCTRNSQVARDVSTTGNRVRCDLTNICSLVNWLPLLCRAQVPSANRNFCYYYSGCRITFLSLKKLFVFPFFRIARIGGNAQIILGKCKNYFKQQKNAFEIILVYHGLQKYFKHLKTSFASYDCKFTFFCNMFQH